jgi:hypothetical protein
MSRLIASCLCVLAAAAVSVAAASVPVNANRSTQAAVKAASVGVCVERTFPTTVDSNTWWRFTVTSDLDCVSALVDRALEADEEGDVTIARADLERIRSMAESAKDAALRIGR